LRRGNEAQFRKAALDDSVLALRTLQLDTHENLNDQNVVNCIQACSTWSPKFGTTLGPT
jgi:hypothetical protein